jgi:transposase
MPRPVNQSRRRRIAAAWMAGMTIARIAEAEGIGWRRVARHISLMRRQGMILDRRPTTPAKYRDERLEA